MLTGADIVLLSLAIGISTEKCESYPEKIACLFITVLFYAALLIWR